MIRFLKSFLPNSVDLVKHLFLGSATRAAYNWYRALLYRHDAAMFVCLIGSLPTWHSAVCRGNIFNIVFYKNTMEIHRNRLLNCGQKNLTSSGTSVGTAVTNPPVVFPKSSCDVHLLRLPWLTPQEDKSPSRMCGMARVKMELPVVTKPLTIPICLLK